MLIYIVGHATGFDGRQERYFNIVKNTNEIWWINLPSLPKEKHWFRKLLGL